MSEPQQAPQTPPPDALDHFIQEQIAAGKSHEEIVAAGRKFVDDRDPLLTQMGHTLRGALTGAVSGAVGAATLPFKMVGGLASDAVDMYHGEPPAYTKGVLDSIADLPNLPSRLGAMTHEERGEAIGNIAGGALTGNKLLAPSTYRGTARRLGGAMEAAGTSQGGFPLRIVAMSKALAGNPAAIPAILAPGAIGKAGTFLREWGEQVPMGGPMAPGLQRVVSAGEDFPGRQISQETADAAESAMGRKGALTNKGVPLRLSKAQEAQLRTNIEQRLGKTIDTAETSQGRLADLDKSAAAEARYGVQRRAAATKAESSAVAAEDRADLDTLRSGNRDADFSSRERLTTGMAEPEVGAGGEPPLSSGGTRFSPEVEARIRARMESGRTPGGPEAPSARPAASEGSPAPLAASSRPWTPPAEDDAWKVDVQKRILADKARQMEADAAAGSKAVPTREQEVAAAVEKARKADEIAAAVKADRAARAPAAPEATSVAPAAPRKAPIRVVERPQARAYSSDAPATPVPAREPSRLIVTPEEAAAQDQQLRALKPAARLQGMKAAARVPRGELEDMLAKSGLSEQAKQIIRNSVGTTQE